MIHDESRVLIKAERLCKTYKLGNNLKDAVTDVDLRIALGEFVVIEGLSGLQKNTFFNLMGCLEKPTSGKYYFDYEDIALAGTDILDDIRKLKLGYLFRNYNLIGRLTVLQNIEVPMHGLNISREEKNERLLKALRSFDIESISAQIAYSLTDYQKQLVALARAVVNSPLMIIADEPAANLSSKEEQELLLQLSKLNSQGTAIMLITEKADMKALTGCRRIIFEAGRIVEDKQTHRLSLVRREA